MFLSRYLRIAAAAAIFSVFSMPAYAGEGVKTKEFLTFDYASQAYFIEVSVNTATVIATQIQQDMAQCIADWYGDEPEEYDGRNAEILASMKRLPNTYPSAVLVAILQKHCGKFGQ